MRYIKYLLIIIFSLVIFFAAKSGASNYFSALNKLTFVLNLVEEIYVEEPDMDELIEGSIRGALEALDPHSTYISSEEFEKIEEVFKGDFEGIGIEFSILDGFITVISPIPEMLSRTRCGLLKTNMGARNIHIYGHDVVDAHHNRIRTVIRTTVCGAAAHRDNPFWVRHLFI